ncbi:MAG: efflux RND transporter periplasmic adaptor subunit [Gemmatimonadales bacterium]
MKSYNSNRLPFRLNALGFALVAVFTLQACDQTADSPQTVDQHENEAEAHSDEEPAIVEITEEQARELGVRVAQLSAGSAASVVERPATLTLDPDRVAYVGPRIEAKVERVLRDLGDSVVPGQALAIMSSVQLGEAKARHLALKARLATARATLERERQLNEERISSDAELLEAQAAFQEAQADVDVIHETLRLYGLSIDEIEAIEPDAQEPLSFFRLTSPVAGIVQRRDLSPGMTVGPEDVPIHIVRPDHLWVLIDAYESDLPLLETGQRVSLALRSVPNQLFEAVTDWISYALEPETRTIRVRAILDNSSGLLRAGMFGTASIHTANTSTHAVLPVDAVQTLDGQQVVFIPTPESGGFQAVAVRVGNEGGGFLEIIDGLAPGDYAVVAGAFELMSAATAGSRSADHGH